MSILITSLLLWLSIAVCNCEQRSIANQISQILEMSYDKTEEKDISQIIVSNFPYFKNECVSEALSAFLPQCLKHGIETVDSSLRVEAALKLSICEFEASGLKNIPSVCQHADKNSLENCIAELEKSPQWWTTYSGNFQHLPSLCFENSLPYEKDQILEVFLKITEIHVRFQQEFETKLEETSDMFDVRSRENLNKLQSTFDQSLIELIKLSQYQKDVFLKSFDNIQGTAFKDLSKNVESFQSQFLDLDSKFIQEFAYLKTLVEDITEELNELDVAQEIKKFKKNNLSNFKDLSVASDNALQIQKAYFDNVDIILSEFYSDAERKFRKLDDEIHDSSLDTVLLLKDFNNLVQTSVIPLLNDDLVPQLKEASLRIFQSMEFIDEFVEGKLESWNEEFDSTFCKIESRLNSTASLIEELDGDLGCFQDNFRSILLIFTGIKASFSTFLNLASVLFKHSKMICTIIPALIFTRRCFTFKTSKCQHIVFKWTLRFSLMMTLAVMGSTFGIVIAK